MNRRTFFGAVGALCAGVIARPKTDEMLIWHSTQVGKTTMLPERRDVTIDLRPGQMVHIQRGWKVNPAGGFCHES